MRKAKVISFTFEDARNAATARDIRTKVFVEEQGVPAELEYDVYDEIARHYLLLVDGEPVATARWRETTGGIKLERFAMLSACRNQGLGKLILSAVMDDVLESGKRIYLHAQERAVSFYERFGFSISGEAFEEAGIRHFLMCWPQDSGSSTQDPLS